MNIESDQKNYECNKRGYFGRYGGRFVAELLRPPLIELEDALACVLDRHDFQDKLRQLLNTYVGRPTPLTEVTAQLSRPKGPRIFLKREDLLHTGAHKINNALGQCLLAQYMGKRRVIAETGAGQHGVATATACAYLGLDCVVYMGAVDTQRQAPNVEKMKLLGASVVPVASGNQTLKEAVSEALRDWSTRFDDTHYCMGSSVGPHPYPYLVGRLQSVIGQETRAQCLNQWDALPNYIVACVGGGSNAIGMFSGFLQDDSVTLVGVEAGGRRCAAGQHAASIQQGIDGVLHGFRSRVLQDSQGQILSTHSVSAGLDYPSVGPQHAHLAEINRVHYESVSDTEAIEAFKRLTQSTGIIPALESAHAVAYVLNRLKQYSDHQRIVINLSGRGDKDLPRFFKEQTHESL